MGLFGLSLPIQPLPRLGGSAILRRDTVETDPYRLPTMNINYLLPFEDFRRLVDRSEPQHEEARAAHFQESVECPQSVSHTLQRDPLLQ